MTHSELNVSLKRVPRPDPDCTGVPVELSDDTMQERKDKVLTGMKQTGLDALIVYADLEHGSNFEYLVGFLPRFEEALLVLHRDGNAYLMLGNENLNKASKSRLPAKAIHTPHFSLPDQPMETGCSFREILAKTGIAGKRIGISGWKKFTGAHDNNLEMYDVPHYIIRAAEELCGSHNMTNAAGLFIGSEGARITNTPNEIAHYEFGASLSSDCVMAAMDSLKEGIREMDAADHLVRFGQTTLVVTIAAFGERYIRGNMYPSSKRLSLGDTVSLTVGYKGGLTSRAGYAAEREDQLPAEVQDYCEKLAAPYFRSIAVWLEEIHVGMTGGELYQLIEEVLPKADYHWGLCPGHLTADEEWLCSPIRKGSQEILKSGMMLQTDIIPSIAGYGGVSAESPCLLADKALREAIKKQYPQLYARMMRRREYIIRELGIHLSEDILPTASSLAYMRPLMLGDQAFTVSH